MGSSKTIRRQVTPDTQHESVEYIDDSNAIGSKMKQQQQVVYHTPPYETNRNSSITLPHSGGGSPISTKQHQRTDNLFQRKFLLQMGKRLSMITTHLNNDLINNSIKTVIPFINEVIGRSKCSKQTILLAAVYFQNIYGVDIQAKMNKKFVLPEFVHCAKRTFLCCLIIAHKFLNDNTFTMKSWHLISGLSQKHLSMMERWCLMKLNYNLNVNNTELLQLENDLLTMIKNDELLSLVLVNKNTNSQKRSIGAIEDCETLTNGSNSLRPKRTPIHDNSKKLCKVSV